MKRVDCEKCFHSEFEDGDKLRCRLKKCQPEYEDLKEKEKCIPFATIQIDKNYLQKIVDEKLKSIELDIQAIRDKAIDDFAGKLKTEYKNALSIQTIEKETAYFAIDKVAEQLKGEKI